MNNQYQCFGGDLTTDCARKLIQELFGGQTVQRREIVNTVFEQHHQRGGMNSGVRSNIIQSALRSMKESGLAANSAYGVWHITYYVKTLNEFMKWAAQFDSGEDSKQYLFRGVSSADYKIDASAYRRIKKGRDNDEEQEGDFEKFLQINKDLIRDARFRGHDQKNGRKLEDLEVLAEFQHYGAATFLMDFTYNALVALWFACKENSKNGPKGGKVVAVPPNDPKFTSGTGEFSIIILESLEKKIDEFFLDNKKLYQWQPRSQNERIIAQQSIFLFGVLEIEIDHHEECIIDQDSKEKIRESLKQIYGVSEDMLFPDFDGFARQYSQDRSYEELSATQYRQRAYEAHQKGEYEAAIRDYNEVIHRTSNDADAYYHRGLANNGLSRYEAALNDFDTAISLPPNPKPNDAYIYHHRGLANNGLSRYEAALNDFDTAISLPPNPKPNDVYSYHWRGNVNYMLEQYEAAIADYDAANRFRPNPNAEYSHHWCGLANNELERYQEAINNFDEAIRINSDNTHSYHHRGLANIGLEEYEAAITDFDEAIRINPNDAHSYYNQGLVKFRLNRLSKAEEDLQIALQLSEQIDDAELIGNIRYLLYEINSRTVGGSDE